MKVLLIGSGGREHALAYMISRSPRQPRLYVLSDYVNPGLENVAEATGGKLYVGKTTDPQVALRVAREVNPDLVVIGPEEPLFHGVSDALLDEGLPVFGARSRLAEIEKSKVFARQLQWKYRIPGRLRFTAAKSLDEAAKAAEAMGDAAVKPARQAGGHGVKVFAAPAPHVDEAAAEVRRVYAEQLARRVAEKYGDIEHLVIVEERVEGVEYTLMTITDGSTVLPLPIVQDQPYLFIHDIGPETGGMGAIAGPGWTLPFITRDELEETKVIVERTIEALRRETGLEYRGALSAQSMLTALQGPVLIEYYARFGDPEISALAPIIESDMVELLERAATGKLAGAKLEIREDLHVVVKIVAPRGYPENRAKAKNHPIDYSEALEAARKLGCHVFTAGVYRAEDGRILTTGSRALEIVCASPTSHHDASMKAEKVIAGIRLLDGWELIHRRDIGTEQHVQLRIEEAERIRRVYLHRRRMGLGRVVYDWVPGRGVQIYDYG
ncbi:phosphoribosylamine/glycine ligase [Pyrolobus fumarii 1A]|uniref:phosphoribosylamine--glycine ligase n=1 Tax=Pyrolobus fumarii (strain DSM 11204 / 1A) TaxID=694429 RepID=G0EFS7_PYRF1|nr:phosphoribosylamine--glycine ligase [Pyrolobus fumarii]AEM38248.1 phosphoribosylamine/glycine ligase [Pyrolobus fumarii 1A]